MNEEHINWGAMALMWTRLAMLIVLLVAAGALVMWLQSNFGAATALIGLGVVIGIGAFVAGAMHNQRSTQGAVRETVAAIGAVTDMVHERQRVNVELARQDTLRLRQAEQTARQIANASVRGYLDMQAEAKRTTPPAQTWNGEGADDGAPRFFE